MDRFHLLPGANRLADRAVAGASVWPRWASAHVELVSSLVWRTDAQWSIPPRSCADTLLFIPIQGTIELELAGTWRRLAPGGCAVIPTGERHAARYAAGCREWHGFALHVHARDDAGTEFFHGFGATVVPLERHDERCGRLADLTALAARDRAAAAALAVVELGTLVRDLLFAGAIYTEPAARDPRIAATLRALHADPGARLGVAALARIAGLSPARFRALFRVELGESPKAYQDRQRLAEAARRLTATTVAVRAIAADLGYANDHHLHRRFKAAYGCTPSAWRQRRPAV